jgi:hypothetical protein
LCMSSSFLNTHWKMTGIYINIEMITQAFLVFG